MEARRRRRFRWANGTLPIPGPRRRPRLGLSAWEEVKAILVFIAILILALVAFLFFMAPAGRLSP